MLAALAGCGSQAVPPATADAEGDPLGVARARATAADPALFRELQGAFSSMLDEAGQHYQPVVYEYDEDLLAKVDHVEARLRGVSDGEPMRVIPGIDLAEEDDHFRVAFRRWAEQTGLDLRAEVDRLKREKAALDPGEAFHPEFHRSFAAVFDSFIPIEVEEMRRRKNRVVHRKAEEMLAPHRESHPEIVAYFEAVLDQPQFRVEPE